MQKNNIKKFKVFEADIKKNTGVDKDYIDDIEKDVLDKIYMPNEEEEMKALMDMHRKIGFVPDMNRMVPPPMPRPGEPMPSLSEIIRNTHFIWKDQRKKKSLENLIVKIATEQYQTIINALNIELDVKLVLPNNLLDDVDDIPDTAPNEEIEKDLIPDIDKRKIVNSIIQGSAKNSHRLIHMYKDDFDEITPGLTDSLDEVIKNNENKQWYILLKSTPEDITGGAPGGVAKVDYEDTDDGDFKMKVIARGVDPIILLHETVKGIYEAMLQSGSLPEDSEKAREVLKYTDTKQDEEQDLLYGEYIKKDLVNFISSHPDIDKIPNGIEYICGHMVELPTQDFLKLIKDILIEKTNFSKNWLNDSVKYFIEQFDKYNKDKTEYDLDNQEDSEQYNDKAVLDYSEWSERELQNALDTAFDNNDKELIKKLGDELSRR
jgi:hypothetical protein